MTPRHQAPTRTWKDRRAALKNLPPTFGLIWASAPTYAAMAVGFRVLSALMPLTALWLGKKIIDLIVAGAGHTQAGATQIWWLVAAEFLVAAAGALLSRGTDFCDGRIEESFAREVNLRVI